MEDKLIEYTDKIVEALEAGVDFAGEQAPILIQEVLQYYLTINIIWGVVFAVVSAIFVYLGIRAFKSTKEDLERMGMFAFFASIPSFIFSMIFWTSVIKISIAPRLYLIQKLAELL